MLGKATTRFARGSLLQHLILGFFLQARLTETVGIVKVEGGKLDRVADNKSQALFVDTRGSIHNYANKEQQHNDDGVHDSSPRSHVRRQVGRRLLDGDLLPAAAGKKGVVLLQLKETTKNIKIIGICLVSILALMLMCWGTWWLIWQPLSAIFEERAYEQAAQAAMLAGEIKKPAPELVAQGDEAAITAALAEQIRNRQEKLEIAWMVFLDNKLLAIKSCNLLAKLMHDLLSSDAFHVQLEDLYNGLAPQGTDSIKRECLERVCEAVEGQLHNMHIKDSISHVDYENGVSCSMAVTEVEDYHWLFDHYDKVFPEEAPLDKKCFVGMVSLVVVWNCVRTLHTARHMDSEHGQFDATCDQKSGKVAVDIRINLRMGFPLEAHSEFVFDPTHLEDIDFHKDGEGQHTSTAGAAPAAAVDAAPAPTGAAP